MKENEKWIDALRKRLEDYSEPAPASGWERLERELMPPVEKRIYPYRRWAVAAAAVVLVVASSVSLYFLNSPVADEIRRTPALATAPDALPETTFDMEVVRIEPAKPVSPASANDNRMLAKAEAHPVTVAPETLPEEVVEAVVAKEPEKVAEKEIYAEEHAEPRKEARRPSSRDKLHLPDNNAATRKGGKWSTGLSVGNGGSTSAAGGNDFVNPLTQQRVNLSEMATNVVVIPGDKELVFEDGVPYLQTPRETPKIEHHLPVTVGLSVRKSLPKGFSVETGLNYTLLSSDVTMPGDDKIKSQKLHYLGIPVRANWNFYDKKKFTLYVSGGGMMEKCVYGKLAGEKIDVDPLQFSVMGAVGAQFNVTQRIGIYVEPGVSYYFDDGSEIQTIRKETPVNFNLQGGIRFTY